MKPVDMTTVHEPPDSIGDCFRCCIASILELPPEDVPHVYDSEGWRDESGKVGMQRLQDFLRERGFRFLEIEWEADALPNWKEQLAFHHTLSGISPRGNQHAVVGYGGQMVHDPHPSRAGIAPENGNFRVGIICKL